MPKISDERLDSMLRLLPEQRKCPEVSLNEHAARRSADLAQFVLARRRVYLDTRYWIFLRDSMRGRPQKRVHRELLDGLLARVSSGSVLCPISDSTFIELLRQSDPASRIATAHLVDALSLGVAVENARDRLRTELLWFLIGTAIHKTIAEAPIRRIWRKVGHVLGTPEPAFDGVSPEEQLAISKAFFDVMWSVTLEELLTDTPWVRDPADEAFATSAAQITQTSRAHASEIGSFAELNLGEIRGFFEIHTDELCDAFAQLHAITEQNARLACGKDFYANRQILVNVFSNVFRHGKAGTSLPTAQIVAGLHAVVRWHRERPFKSSDFYDIYHATAALPYCDVFLTERFLGNALTRPPLDLAKHFKTVVIWEDEAALQCVRML